MRPRRPFVHSSQGLVLAFKLLEKRSYSLRKVEFAPPRFREKVRIEEGEEFDEVRAQKLAADLRRQLVEGGHPRPKVTTVRLTTRGRAATDYSSMA